ncbi:hypothetical protein QVD17_30837 [Tagetes erecta]|uniref:Uncharacterized protein n=1 Tax=Tagetes erecta TaxID=13708 RepID=A0AAD8NNB9_TARER|nr:hypothetical protein QVD17_30837 [Tagetes erecta]
MRGYIYFGLRALRSDANFVRFSKCVGECKLFNVHTEHDKTNLHTYFCSPSKATIKVIDDDGEVDVLDTSKKGYSKLMLCWPETGSSNGSGRANIESETSIVYQPLGNQPTVEQTTYVPILKFDELNSFGPFDVCNEVSSTSTSPSSSITLIVALEGFESPGRPDHAMDGFWKMGVGVEL